MITSFNPQQSQMRQRQAFGTRFNPKVAEIIITEAKAGRVTPERAATIKGVLQDGKNYRTLDIIEGFAERILVLRNERTQRQRHLELKADRLDISRRREGSFNIESYLRSELSAEDLEEKLKNEDKMSKFFKTTPNNIDKPNPVIADLASAIAVSNLTTHKK